MASSKYLFLFLVLIEVGSIYSSSSPSSDSPDDWYTIEGRIISPDSKKQPVEWFTTTQVLANGGEYVGNLRDDGSFVFTGVSPGSYVIEIIHPNVHYESARVDITSKGKIRGRRVNYIQPNLVAVVPYPLKLSALGPYKFFQTREEWRITDVLMSPMVIMMILPLLLIVIIPKMMSDPETRREMESVTMPKYEMPEMSEMLTSFFGGGSSSSSHKKEEKRAIRSRKAN